MEPTSRNRQVAARRRATKPTEAVWPITNSPRPSSELPIAQTAVDVPSGFHTPVRDTDPAEMGPLSETDEADADDPNIGLADTTPHVVAVAGHLVLGRVVAPSSFRATKPKEVSLHTMRPLLGATLYRAVAFLPVTASGVFHTTISKQDDRCHRTA